MHADSVVLFNSSFIGSSAAVAMTWGGGRSALVVSAQAYSANGLQFQVQSLMGSWINIGSSIIGDQSFPFDAPPGQYRMTNESASSVIGISAVLTRIPR